MSCLWAHRNCVVVQPLEFMCPELESCVLSCWQALKWKYCPCQKGVGEEAQPKRHSVKIGWVTQLWCTQWLTTLQSPPCMLVFVRPWKTEGFCSDKYLNKDTQHTQERRKRTGRFSCFYTCPQIVGAVFTEGSLAGSLGRSFICPTVQLCVSRCQQKGRGGFAEPGGSWQDQDCLSVTPAAGWGLSAGPHPEKPALCFFFFFLKSGFWKAGFSSLCYAQTLT